ncbi:hypothetical protein ACFQZS_07200 [Mucilaginibacter calamicampi]|uniref:TonB C-terminal domain-containing protein n=1 Tax=Mucilaginibacter calamicampi TaxID=1302352 RepID=A0ABW2YX03_9SPHI
MRRFTIYLLISILSTFSAKADKVIINGDTTNFWPNKSALEQHPDIKGIKPFLKGYKTGTCMDCEMVDYIAEWTIIDNTVYLTGIYPGPGAEKEGQKADLNKIFHASNSRVKATWVNADFWIPIGKPLRWANMMTPVYKAEFLFVIKNGKVAKKQQFNYPSGGRPEDKEILEFIYSHISWDKIPPIDQQKKVFVVFETGISGKPEKAAIMRGKDCVTCNEEALRALSGMPWPPDYKQGKIYPFQYTVPLTFSEEQRKKYGH